MGLPKHIAVGITLASLTLSAQPAAAGKSREDETYVAGVQPAYNKKWAFDDWNVWATQYGTCLALQQDNIGWPTYHVWGFEQSPGSRLTMYFGSIQNAQPQTVQMSWNNGGAFAYDAQVKHLREWDAYEISLQANALSVFPRQLTVVAHVKGERVFINVYNSMDRLRKTMAECLAFQQAN